MPGVSRIDFIADQLRGMTPGLDWNIEGIDRAQELARILDRAGVLDLSKLKFMKGYAMQHIPAHEVETESAIVQVPAEDRKIDGYYFDYPGKRIGYLGTPTEPATDPLFQMTDRGLLLAWSAEGHGNVSYYVRPNAKKTALEIAPVWGSSSDAATARQWITMIASFFLMTALPLAGVNVGATIGNAVLPASLTAAYPGLATAVGNVALSTAFNGGDVAGAVKNVVVGQVAGGAGDFTGGALSSLTDSELIGNLASVATRTAIVGGDLKTAVGMELLKLGATVDTSGFDFFGGSGGSVFGDSFNAPLDPSNGWDFSIPSPDIYIPTPGANGWETWMNFQPEQFEIPTYEDFDPSKWDPFQASNGGVSTPIAGQPPVSPTAPPETVKPPPTSTVFNPMQMVQQVTGAAMAALGVVKAYRQLNSPQINTTARIVRPDGSVSAITSNGMIQTRDASGRVVSQKPPVGIPQSTVDGNIIINNGNGTYTAISPTGQTATYSYGTGLASSASAISPALLLGGAAVLLLLLKR